MGPETQHRIGRTPMSDSWRKSDLSKENHALVHFGTNERKLELLYTEMISQPLGGNINWTGFGKGCWNNFNANTQE